MPGQNKVTGVVLAGGQASRMNFQDKGLIELHGRALISYALAAMSPLVDELLISANRNQESYSQYGYPVISDNLQGFNGPLAGILAAMKQARHPILLVMPCDAPLMQTAHLQSILLGLNDNTDIATATDGNRLHPVFLAIRTQLHGSLESYLQKGERKLSNWLFEHRVTEINFSGKPELFINLNTPAELAELEKKISQN